MRKAIIWTFSVWKTTYVNKENAKVKIMDNERKWWWQWKIFFRELLDEFKYRSEFITDNWLFTILAYSYYENKFIYYIQLFITKIYLKLFPYDEILFIYINRKIEDDWFRYIDEIFQRKIERRILKIIHSMWLEYSYMY